jgi:hypothetical protein
MTSTMLGRGEEWKKAVEEERCWIAVGSVMCLEWEEEWWAAAVVRIRKGRGRLMLWLGVWIGVASERRGRQRERRIRERREVREGIGC